MRNRHKTEMGESQTLHFTHSFASHGRLISLCSPFTEFEGIIPQKSHYVPRIPLTDILEATACFSNERKIGSGGFGDVYFGKSRDGAEWAVKRARGAMDKTLPIFQNEVFLPSSYK